MFPERLKQLRKEKGLTQVTLAETLGVSKGTVAMWETSIIRDVSQPPAEFLSCWSKSRYCMSIVNSFVRT